VQNQVAFISEAILELHVNLTKSDGTAIGDKTGNIDGPSVTNNFLHSCFKDVKLLFNDVNVGKKAHIKVPFKCTILSATHFR
jgi:hypothetical protein